jgi:hypothetical protein
MSITIEQIREAIRRTRIASERVQHRDIDAIIHSLVQTAKNWLEPGNPWRKRAIEQAPSVTGFSPAMVNEAIDLTFSAITEETLRELLVPYNTPHLDPLPQGERKRHTSTPRPVGGEAGPAVVCGDG